MSSRTEVESRTPSGGPAAAAAVMINLGGTKRNRRTVVFPVGAVIPATFPVSADDLVGALLQLRNLKGVGVFHRILLGERDRHIAVGGAPLAVPGTQHADQSVIGGRDAFEGYFAALGT